MKSYSPQSDLIPHTSYRFVSSTELSSAPWQGSVKRSGWGWLWQALMNGLAGNSEPKIYRKVDRHGNTYFRVYDPTTGVASTFGSEREIRVWLDERYNR